MPRHPLVSALFCVGMVAFTPTAPRAETVEATSTTLALTRQEWRDGVLYRTVPAYELLSISARDIQSSVAQNLSVVISTWGAVDLGDIRWDVQNPSQRRLTGDLNLAFIEGELWARQIRVRLGRQMVMDGVARAVQLDGADVTLRLDMGLGLSAYAGSPVSQRFDGRGGLRSSNPIQGDLTAGGRVFWIQPGLLEVGLSGAWARDRFQRSDGTYTHAIARQDLGADARVLASPTVTLVGYGLLDLFERRIGDGDLSAIWQPNRKLKLTADYRHVDPSLLLARDSILAVFASDARNELGVMGYLGYLAGVSFDGDYHVILLDGGGGTGHRVLLKGTAHPLGPFNTVGGELSLWHQPDNGYFQARVFGGRDLGPVAVTLDLQNYVFENAVNGKQDSFLATATGGYVLGGGWKAAVSASAGVTPYLRGELDLMAKLVYNQTYTVREVR